MSCFLKKKDSWSIRIDKIKELLILIRGVFSLDRRGVGLGIGVPVLDMGAKQILRKLSETILGLEIIGFPVFGIAIDFIILINFASKPRNRKDIKLLVDVSANCSNLINLTIFITPINLWGFLMKIISLHLFPLLFKRCLLFHIHIHTFFFWCILHLCNSWNIVYLIVLFELEIIYQTSILSLLCCLWWTSLQRVWVLACV